MRICLYKFHLLGEEGCAHFINYWADSKPYSLLFEHGNKFEKYHKNLTNIWGPPRGFIEMEVDISYDKVSSNDHQLNLQGQKNKKKEGNQHQNNNNPSSTSQYFEKRNSQGDYQPSSSSSSSSGYHPSSSSSSSSSTSSYNNSSYSNFGRGYQSTSSSSSSDNNNNNNNFSGYKSKTK